MLATQRIADAGVDSRLRPENHQPDPLLLGKRDEPDDVGGANRNVAPQPAGAAVAGRAVNALDQIRLHALPNQGVLASTGTDDEDLHQVVASVSRPSGASGAPITRCATLV